MGTAPQRPSEAGKDILGSTPFRHMRELQCQLEALEEEVLTVQGRLSQQRLSSQSAMTVAQLDGPGTEEAAAHVIQRRWRHRSHHRRQVVAVTVIQKGWRAREHRRQTAAASAIQRRWRGASTRKNLRVKFASGLAAITESDDED